MQECRPRNKYGERHGCWETYWGDDQLWYKGTYINNIPNGYWEEYHLNGQLLFKGNYVNGQQDGYWITSNNEYYYARI